MENGSRALIMAATVLLGVFLLTIMIIMFRAGGNVSRIHDERHINLQLEKYNGQFEIFDSTTNTITDVVTLANLVYSTNEEVEYSKDVSVQLDVDIGGVIYSIPSDLKDANKIKPSEKKYLTKRNTIALGTAMKEVSIYDLLNCPVNRLRTLEDTAGQHIEIPIYGSSPELEKTITEADKETLSQTRLDANNRRIYKYIFACESDDGFKYHDISGKVKYIKLKLYINPDY